MYCYVFVDESGNYDFSRSGTKYWVLTSAITEDVHPGILDLYDLKHELSNLDIERFHATEDKQLIRDRVFKIISGLTNIRVDSLIVEKRKTGPSLRPVERFYPEMMEHLLKYPLDPRGIDVSRYEKVLFFFDRAASTRKQQDALMSATKKYLAKHMKGVPYTICMHSSASHHYLQIVDYLSWAMYVKWERGEHRPYSAVSHLFKSEFDIFESGTTIWY